MNPTLIMEIADLALALTETLMKKDSLHEGVSVADTLIQIIRKSLQAYAAHTGKPVPQSVIKA